MKNNANVLLLLEAPNESQKESKELGISHLGSELLHATRRYFVDLLMEAVKLYIRNLTKLTAVRNLSFY